MNEQVLVTPAFWVERLGIEQGVTTTDVASRLQELLDKSSFMDREQAEKATAFRQIIPYHVVRRDFKLLQYARTKHSGEIRLRSKRSIGFGGHINTEDAQGAGGMVAYVNGSKRELEEELIIASPNVRNQVVGILIDDRTEVGLVHIGFIHFVDLDSMGGVSSKDRAIDLIGFEFPNVVAKGYQFLDLPLEGWSELTLEHIIKNEPTKNPLTISHA